MVRPERDVAQTTPAPPPYVKPTTTYGVSESGIASSVLPDTMSISVHSGAPGSVFSGSFVAAIIDKYKQSGDDKIIGLVDPVLVIKCDQTLTSTSDFTTYPDRALVELTNSSGSTANLQGLSIRGKTVEQLSNGYEWEYTDHNDIEMRGESALISINEYIVTGPQLEAVGDYLVKESKPHDVYTITIPGCHYEYEVGDVWHLTLDYTIQAQVSQCELIDVDVEIISSSINRSVGSIGTTLLDVMVPSGAWTKTIGRRARLISLGYGNMLNNRGNVLTVASSTWTGQADYYCDGTDDNVQIQAAIDSVSSRGGGIVELTRGTFYAATYIAIKDNCILSGDGIDATFIKPTTVEADTVISMSTRTNATVCHLTIGDAAPFYHTPDTDGSNFIINGSNSVNCRVHDLMIYQYQIAGAYAGQYLLGCIFFISEIVNVIIKEVYCLNSSGGVFLGGVYESSRVLHCTADYLVAGTSSGASIPGVSGFWDSEYITNCQASNLTATGGTSGYVDAFATCRHMSNNKVLTLTGSATTGFSGCSIMQGNSSAGATPYFASYADAAATYACADTPNGGFNS